MESRVGLEEECSRREGRAQVNVRSYLQTNTTYTGRSYKQAALPVSFNRVRIEAGTACYVMVADSAVPSMLHEFASLIWKAASISVCAMSILAAHQLVNYMVPGPALMCWHLASPPTTLAE